MSDHDRIAYLAGDPTGALDDVQTRAELDDVRDLLANPRTWQDPANSLEQSVVAAVQRAATDESTIRPSNASPSRIVSLDAARRKRALRLGMAAAAAVAILVAGVVVVRGNDPQVDFAMTLEPTELVPNANGEATLTRTESGWRIELDATGLARLDDGRFYQAWLRDADGNLVPIGTFNEGRDVILWAGVSPIDFPTLTVTEESNDGDQTSSGRRVLVGTIGD